MLPDISGCKIISGEVQLPPSKSILNRLLIIADLAGQELPPQSSSDSGDSVLLRNLLQRKPEQYYAGMAGTVARFLTARLAILPGEHLLTAADRMLLRPMAPLIDVLQSLGADITCLGNEGFLPLRIGGVNMKGGKASISGEISSQFISALLMVAPYFKNGLELDVRPPFHSKPYALMTAALMREAGAEVEITNNRFIVPPKLYHSFPSSVESDWSSAAFFYQLLAVARTGSLVLPGLKKNSLQGDAFAATFYGRLGVESKFTGKGVHIQYNPHQQLPGKIDIDCSAFPDLVQSFACACAALKIPARFTGISTLRDKETDRLGALYLELMKLGVLMSWDENRLELISFRKAKPVTIRTYGDHRMAMAFAPLHVLFPKLKIENPAVVAKSFPHYWDELKAVCIMDGPMG
ncbi:MAG: 3-phosphoshikimate 1-carboxyvinyltransferase [Cryomorphaceae bacterium]|nr:MAG: 3-phosphoshikimate 1-carboxyvinyltransferase [Cryomorphaceae bacterium]